MAVSHKRYTTLALITALLGTGCTSFAADYEHVAGNARAYRGDTPVAAETDGTIIAEAEEFKPVGDPSGGKGWQAKNWGENYYAATFANTFLSRKAFLGAPEQVGKSEATITVEVPKAGHYLALARYEAAFRFETQFKVRIEQAGKVKLERLFGARDNVKIWAWKGGDGKGSLRTEIGWYWGAVENVVWEGHDAGVDLEAGPATITLIADKQPEPAAKRNVDLIMLTSNIAEVNDRIAKEGYLPLDGMLTQAGDVFMRITNNGTGALTVTAPPGRDHSPYWIHIRNWKPQAVAVEPGKTSGWTDVGCVLDTLNDGQWSLTAAPAVKDQAVSYKVEFALKTPAGKFESIGTFPSTSLTLDLAYDGNTRYTKRVRTIDHVLYDLADYLKKNPVPGDGPKRTIVYAATFDPRPGDAAYTKALAEFGASFPLTGPGGESTTPDGKPSGYIDIRGVTAEKLEEYFAKFKGDPAKYRTVSLGDEIGLPVPGADADEAFRSWAKGRGLKAGDVTAGAGDDWAKVLYAAKADPKTTEPHLYYYSRLFSHEHGIASLKTLTDIIRKHMPNADTGANFSPHAGAVYLGEAFQWISLFRKGGMTMPWGEDYIWQIPIGTQQMNFLLLDLFRAGLRYKPAGAIQWYVMPHWPGNTPNSWRRQFFGDLGHGMKIANLFEFRPVQAAYTENHCSLPGMFLEVKRSMHEMAKFEDIVQDGHVRDGVGALWYSEAGDAWGNHAAPFGAGKRTLMIAARHQQVPMDIVDEEDAIKGTLKQYKLLYIADQNVSRPASKAIAEWVSAGGRLICTAGAGMKDEFNQPNDVMEKLLGVKQTALEIDDKLPIHFEKQDLPFAKEVDSVSMAMRLPGMKNDRQMTFPVFACKSKVTLSGAGACGKFADGSPGVTINEVGKGFAVYYAFLPGLSYFKPAMPLRPADRGSTDDSGTHFIPTDFDPAITALLWQTTLNIDRPVTCSEPLVEANVIESNHGTAITLTNWSKGAIKGLVVRINIPVGKKAELASGGKINVENQEGKTLATFDLNVADAIILR
jgi:hypothetical protein